MNGFLYKITLLSTISTSATCEDGNGVEGKVCVEENRVPGTAEQGLLVGCPEVVGTQASSAPGEAWESSTPQFLPLG